MIQHKEATLKGSREEKHTYSNYPIVSVAQTNQPFNSLGDVGTSALPHPAGYHSGLLRLRRGRGRLSYNKVQAGDSPFLE